VSSGHGVMLHCAPSPLACWSLNGGGEASRTGGATFMSSTERTTGSSGSVQHSNVCTPVTRVCLTPTWVCMALVWVCLTPTRVCLTHSFVSS